MKIKLSLLISYLVAVVFLIIGCTQNNLRVNDTELGDIYAESYSVSMSLNTDGTATVSEVASIINNKAKTTSNIKDLYFRFYTDKNNKFSNNRDVASIDYNKFNINVYSNIGSYNYGSEFYDNGLFRIAMSWEDGHDTDLSGNVLTGGTNYSEIALGTGATFPGAFTVSISYKINDLATIFNDYGFVAYSLNSLTIPFKTAEFTFSLPSSGDSLSTDATKLFVDKRFSDSIIHTSAYGFSFAVEENMDSRIKFGLAFPSSIMPASTESSEEEVTNRIPKNYGKRILNDLENSVSNKDNLILLIPTIILSIAAVAGLVFRVYRDVISNKSIDKDSLNPLDVFRLNNRKQLARAYANKLIFNSKAVKPFLYNKEIMIKKLSDGNDACEKLILGKISKNLTYKEFVNVVKENIKEVKSINKLEKLEENRQEFIKNSLFNFIYLGVSLFCLAWGIIGFILGFISFGFILLSCAAILFGSADLFCLFFPIKYDVSTNDEKVFNKLKKAVENKETLPMFELELYCQNAFIAGYSKYLHDEYALVLKDVERNKSQDVLEIKTLIALFSDNK